MALNTLKKLHFLFRPGVPSFLKHGNNHDLHGCLMFTATLKVKRPKKYEHVKYPERRLRMIEKVPPLDQSVRPPKHFRELERMRGPELVHDRLQYGDFGVQSQQWRNQQKNVSLSKNLCRILRHKAEELGLNVMEGGFVYIDDLLGEKSFRGVTFQQIQDVVENDEYNKFTIRTDVDCDRPKIRANFGHSMNVYVGLSKKVLTRKLIDILKHFAEKDGIRVMKGGFVYVDELLALGCFRGLVTQEDVQEVVANTLAMNMQIDEESGRMKIRALNGHTLEFDGKNSDLFVRENLHVVLRHTAPKLGLDISKEGYIYIDELLQQKVFRGVTEEQILQLYNKRHFSVVDDQDSGRLKIRANFGHSFPVENLDPNLDILYRIERIFIDHDKNTESITMTEEGFISIDDLLKHTTLQNMSSNQILNALNSEDRTKFTMKTDEESGKLMIRANFGESFYKINKDSRISRNLSLFLRHNAQRLGCTLMKGGFFYLDDLLQQDMFRDVTLEEVLQVVEDDEAWRFTIQSEQGTGKLKIRANYGHTVEVSNLDPNVQLYKFLARILRGYEQQPNLRLMSGGYIYLEDILQVWQRGESLTEEAVVQAVSEDVRDSFTLQTDADSGRIKICANFGHTPHTQQRIRDLDK